VKAELNNGNVEVTTTTEQDRETMSFPVDTLPRDMSDQQLKATLFDFLKQNPGTSIYTILEQGFGYTAENAKNGQYQSVYHKLFFSELFESQRDGAKLMYRVANQ
jgi:hypothetical protein